MSSNETTLTKRKMANGKATREMKRAKFEAKQARLRQEESTETKREVWFKNNASFCTRITRQDVLASKNSGMESSLRGLLGPYMNLKESPKSNQNFFIAEGAETVRILIQQCKRHNKMSLLEPIKVQSILVKPATFFDLPVRLLSDVQAAVTNDATPPFQILVGKEDVLSEIAGFNISRGALACGIPPHREEEMLYNLLEVQQRVRLLALDGICDTSNMGAIIRSASAFGVDAILLSQDCCNAWYRRSVRVSMGHVFLVPIFRVGNLASWIEELKRKEITTYAAVVDTGADLLLEEMNDNVGTSWCLVVGSEGNGIKQSVAKACSKTLRIGMADGVDSLSAPVATGILLHGLNVRQQRQAISQTRG